MSKLTRIYHKIFGIDASFSTEMGKYGSLKNGSPAYAANISEIQENANWEGGLYDCVVGNNSPAMQDINGVFHHASRQLGYLFQDGVPEWNTDTTYYTNSFCSYSGLIYKSLLDDNAGFQPDTNKTAWKIYKELVWQEISTDQTLENSMGYVIRNWSGDPLNLILPSTSDVGDEIAILTDGTAGWILKSNPTVSTQKIVNSDSESPASSYSETDLLRSINAYDAVSIRCITDNTLFEVVMNQGASFAGNWFGDGSDGDITFSVDTDLTVTVPSGSYDGEMIVKNYLNMTINSNVTVIPNQPCRGMLIYCQGDCEINGSLSMTNRGSLRNPSDVSATGLRIVRKKSGETDTLSASDVNGCGADAVAAEANQSGISGDGKIYTIAKVGGSGGSAVVSGGDVSIVGNNGSNGAGGQTGGGGSGGLRHANAGTATSGAGGIGTCFSGGAGGGGVSLNAATGSADDGDPYGGEGGSANDNSFVGAGGGAGNPGGAGDVGDNGSDGTGGLLILIVRGDLTIGSNGTIKANGNKGGNIATGAGGGGSGGGSVLVLYGGTLTNNGSVEADGGSGGTASVAVGGDGGAGTVVVEQIDI